MDYTFVSQFSADGPKRRRLAKACESCRARKKRCVHFEKDNDHLAEASQAEPSRNESTTDGTPPTFSGDVNNTPKSLSNGEAANGRVRKDVPRRSSLSALMGSTAQRFISDLHPEARFLERNPSDTAHPRAKATDSVGVWVDRREWEQLVRQRDAANASSEANSQTSTDRAIGLPRPHSTQLAGLLEVDVQQACELRAIGLPRPHSTQLAGLLDVYFHKIHPILPIVNEEEFRQAHAAGLVPEPYVHAICLAAAKDRDAEPHLAQPGGESFFFPRDFCKVLYASVRGALAAPVRYDKITQIRMYALLSLHSEGSEGAEDASLCLTQAMHHIQTLGLHLGQQASLPAKNARPMKQLFWSVWTLDRFNAAINGRPIIMADQDIAIEPFSKGESEFPAFEILLRIAGLMNEVIGFYRPGQPPDVTGWEDRFPGFEEIVDDMNGWSLSPPALSTLHIAYLATAILSHRSKGVQDLPQTTPSHVRQSLAAIQIIRLMRPERLLGLHALPFLPYAISLALSVSYQHLRQDQLRHQQEDGRADLEACCNILHELRRTWSAVDVMATLAQKVLDELKTAPDLSQFRIQRPNKGQRMLAGFATVCRDQGEPVINGQRNSDNPDPLPNTSRNLLLRDMNENTATVDPPLPPQQQDVGQGLFEGMDDIFGTYLDPNYPVNLDDLGSFLDDFGNNVDWTAPAPNM